MFGMLGVFAEFERSMVRERVMAGLEPARAKGKRLGRPRVSSKVERAVLEARAESRPRPQKGPPKLVRFGPVSKRGPIG